MAQITVNPERLRAEAEQMRNIARKADLYSESINQVVSQLNVLNTTASMNTLLKKLKAYSSETEVSQKDLLKLAGALENISTAYEKTEKQITSGRTPLKGNVSFADSAVTASETDSGNNTTNRKSEDQGYDSILDLIKAYLTINEKCGDKNAGQVSSLIDYMKALVTLFSEDKNASAWTGAEDILGLVGESGKLWTKWYDYFEEIYKNAPTGIFSASGAKNVAGLGIVTSMISTIASLCGATDAATSGNHTWAGVIGEYVDAGADAADVAENIYKYKHLADAEATGLYSPAGIYANIAESYTKAFAQGFKSYENYSADGQWSVEDTAKTGIEFGTTGLYNMLDNLSFGIIGSTGVTADDISTGIENWADKTGTYIGNKASEVICSNEALRQSYLNANGVEKGIMTISAYEYSLLSDGVEAAKDVADNVADIAKDVADTAKNAADTVTDAVKNLFHR